MLECPRHPIPLLDKWVGELLRREPADARAPQVAHDNERLPRRTLYVQRIRPGLYGSGSQSLTSCLRKSEESVELAIIVFDAAFSR
jgi:hypothetical protein